MIEGHGEMREWPPLGVPGCSSGYDSISEWHKYSKDIKKVIVGFGVTTISDFTFTYHENMESIILPNTIEALYNDTFLGCDKLESLTLPDSLRYIDSSALFLGLGLKDIYYEGTREQWDAITNGPENYSPFRLHDYVTIHFNSRNPSSSEPSLDDCLANATTYNANLAIIAAKLSLEIYNDENSTLTYLHRYHTLGEGSKFYSNNFGGSLAYSLATRKYYGPDTDDDTYILVIVAQGSTNPYELGADAISLPDIIGLGVKTPLSCL